MAATKTDIAASKEAKQKKILIVGAVVLLLLLAIQLPKIMGGSESTPAAVAATAPADAAASGAPALAAAQTTATPLTAASTPKAGKTQLASFSLFEAKDPFVQQLQTGQGAPGGAAAPATAPGSAPAKDTPAAGGTSDGGQSAKPALTFATISTNGEPESVQVKGTFPADEPLFRLIGVGEKSAKIGIAGGSLKDGKAAVLQMGKKLTLVNGATGARYTLELLYTGSAPEATASFTAGQSGDAGTASGSTP